MSTVSCIMPTADRRPFVPAAIEQFLAQDFPAKELVIVDDGTDRVADIIPDDPRIVYISLPKRTRIGTKRNLACEAARGDVILHWDDDDWYASWRVAYQAEELLGSRFDICGIDRVFFVNAASLRAWEYVHPVRAPRWVCGATLCYRKAWWSGHRFHDSSKGEDSRFVYAARSEQIGILGDNRFFVGRIHERNSCPKRTGDSRWQPRSVTSVASITGSDWEPYFGGPNGLPVPPAPKQVGSALITGAAGVGDILRLTPLMRVTRRLGYATDVLLKPDDVRVAELFAGSREIRRLLIYSSTSGRAATLVNDLRREEYDIVTFTGLSAGLGRLVRAKRRYSFDADWRVKGSVSSVRKIAAALGWDAPLPAPFAVTSGRRFSLPRDTVAIHPGCKSNWPWKRWHGFDELADHFANVAIVGTAIDLENERTYFKRPFHWPSHAKNYVGLLELRDTAALLSQCAALVAPDSGLMHLGVSLAVPTFGIFGATDPAKECLCSPFMTPITKEPECETRCRNSAMPRRGCGGNLRCLKTLSAAEVANRIIRKLSSYEEQVGKR